MSLALYEVVDENGVMYPEKGFDGGQAIVMPFGSKIRESDVEKGFFSLGSLDGLERAGRVKKLGLNTENKEMPSSDEKKSRKKKGANDEE